MDSPIPLPKNQYLGSVHLLDPATGRAVSPGVTIQQVEGGFDPTGLATDTGQDTIVLALEELLAAVRANVSNGEVSIVDDELPPVTGGSTAAKQDAILGALQNLASVLNGTLAITATEPIPVTATDITLPAGSSTASKQDAIIAALNALAEIFRTETLDVSGTVAVEGTVPVSGAVSLTNASIAVTPSGAFAVDLPGSATSAKQDAILSALGGLLTALQAPQVITDGGQSITVDGVVGVSGTIPVTQSGPWAVSVNGTPSVTVANASPIPVSVPTHAVTQSGTWDVNVANQTPISVTNSGTQAVSLASVPTHAVTQSGTWTFIPANAATLTTPPTAISVGTTSVTVAASNTNRKSLIVQNMGSTTLMLCFAATAVATTPTFQVPANGWIVIDRETWTGVVTAIRPSGSSASDAIVTVTS